METTLKNHVDHHRLLIKEAWRLIQPELEKTFSLSLNEWYFVHNLVLKHDVSKYSEEELYGYAQWFYSLHKDKDLFNCALVHHYNCNPHHWQYWLLVDTCVRDSGIVKPVKMPLTYTIEMMLDWTAMSMEKKDSGPGSFYASQSGEMALHKVTRESIGRSIHLFDEMYYKWRETVDGQENRI